MLEWFQVLASNTDGPTWLIDGTLTGTTNPDQNLPESNGHEDVLYITQISRSGASTSDYYSIISWTLWGWVLPLLVEAISIIYSPNQLDSKKEKIKKARKFEKLVDKWAQGRTRTRGIVVYSYADSCRTQQHNEDERHSLFRKIYLSLYLKGCVWEGVGDQTELQYIDPPLLWLSALCLSRSPGLLNRRPGSPLCWVQASSTASCHQRVSKVTDFLSSPSYITVQSPTQTLEWHVWSSSSWNKCHAVHRLLSSGASVYDCTAGFYLVPYCHPSLPTQFLPITAIGMCHFRCLWNGMFGRVEGQYTTEWTKYKIVYESFKKNFRLIYHSRQLANLSIYLSQ